jgi:hypothetical protein
MLDILIVVLTAAIVWGLLTNNDDDDNGDNGAHLQPLELTDQTHESFPLIVGIRYRH